MTARSARPPELADGALIEANAQHARATLEPARLPASSPGQLTVPVTLNARDAAVIVAMADEDYRTPAQQVGWVVAQWLKLHRATATAQQGTAALADGAAQGSSAPRPDGTAQPAAAPPELIPVYHVGDGSAGTGCGKVGLFFRRRIGPGDTIGPGDVVRLDGQPLTAGGLVCGACGGPLTMAPRNWRAGHEEV